MVYYKIIISMILIIDLICEEDHLKIMKYRVGHLDRVDVDLAVTHCD